MTRVGGNINSGSLVALAHEYGFKKIRQNGSHAVFSNGTKIVIIPIHKGKAIGKGLAIKITKQITHT
jgi:predicted RNA binding protein YcfA (HicA-like mRNA interferase family)